MAVDFVFFRTLSGLFFLLCCKSFLLLLFLLIIARILCLYLQSGNYENDGEKVAYVFHTINM